MASKSGGAPPVPRTLIDANQAMAVLSSLHHFVVKRMNREGRSGFRVEITHAGRRVFAERPCFPDAAAMAVKRLSMDKKQLADSMKPKKAKRPPPILLRLVRDSGDGSGEL